MPLNSSNHRYSPDYIFLLFSLNAPLFSLSFSSLSGRLLIFFLPLFHSINEFLHFSSSPKLLTKKVQSADRYVMVRQRRVQSLSCPYEMIRQRRGSKVSATSWTTSRWPQKYYCSVSLNYFFVFKIQYLILKSVFLNRFFVRQ